jgi:restriction system protein
MWWGFQPSAEKREPTVNLEDGVDRWPTFELSPDEYERAVADLVRAADMEILDWRVEHQDSVEGVDGTYVIDVTVRFQVLGADFLMLFECKRHATPVKREHVQVLKDKLDSTGAQKGVVVSASGFQRGALEYAKVHGIACVRLVDGAWTYETKDLTPVVRQPTGQYKAYASQLTDTGYGITMLSDQRDYAREHLFGIGAISQT